MSNFIYGGNFYTWSCLVWVCSTANRRVPTCPVLTHQLLMSTLLKKKKKNNQWVLIRLEKRKEKSLRLGCPYYTFSFCRLISCLAGNFLILIKLFVCSFLFCPLAHGILKSVCPFSFHVLDLFTTHLSIFKTTLPYCIELLSCHR